MRRVLRRARMLQNNHRRRMPWLRGRAAAAKPPGIVAAATAGGVAHLPDLFRLLLLHPLPAARPVDPLLMPWNNSVSSLWNRHEQPGQLSLSMHAPDHSDW